ncbi:MAG: hypothetical protein ACKOTH_00465 [Solirubrobacterales bacterium]
MAYAGWLILLAVGAVLYFAVNETQVVGIDLSMVGLIFMGIAVLGFVISFILFMIRRSDARRGPGPNPPPGNEKGAPCGAP